MEEIEYESTQKAEVELLDTITYSSGLSVMSDKETARAVIGAKNKAVAVKRMFFMIIHLPCVLY